MEKNSTKSLKWLFGLVAFFGLSYLAVVGVQTCSLLFGTPNPIEVEWADGISFLQAFVVIFKFVGAVAFFTCLSLFILNSIKALNDGTLFPKKNVRLLFGSAASVFVSLFCASNMHLVNGTRAIHLDFPEVFVTAVICIFAIIYRVAVQVSEENSLTI